MPNFSTLLTKDNITAVAIGHFDGVHRGHKQLLKQLGEYGGLVVIDKNKANITPKLKRAEYSNYPCFLYDFDSIKGLGGDEKFNEMRTNQKVLKSFTIAPKGKDIEINFPTGADLSVDALTQDGNLKLILRVKNPAFDQSKMSVKSEANETTQSGSSGVSMMPIIVALLLAAAVFVGVRKFLSHKPQKSIDETWRVFEDDASMEGADVDVTGIDEILNDSSFKNQSGSKNANFTNYSDVQEFAKKDEASALNSKNSNDSKSIQLYSVALF